MRQQMKTAAELVAAIEAGKYLKHFQSDPRQWVALYLHPRGRGAGFALVQFLSTGAINRALAKGCR